MLAINASSKDILAGSLAPGAYVDTNPSPYFPNNLIIAFFAPDTDMAV